jgi:hypothetical protein
MTHLPKLRIVFDRFHVINLFNDKLSNLHRACFEPAGNGMIPVSS